MFYPIFFLIYCGLGALGFLLGYVAWDLQGFNGFEVLNTNIDE